MKLWHISDTHFRSSNGANKTTLKNIKELKKKISSEDIVVLTGDITDDGRETQYLQALEGLKAFKGQLLVTPGNHDLGIMGNSFDQDCYTRFVNFRKQFNYSFVSEQWGGLLNKFTIYRAGKLAFLLLDSNYHESGHFARGKMGKKQGTYIGIFAEECKRRALRSVVCMHHSPFDKEYFTEMDDSKAFMRAVTGKVNLVLVGHEHRERYKRYPEGPDRGEPTVGRSPLTEYFSAPAACNSDGVPIVVYSCEMVTATVELKKEN
jgi:3',5'-cyclic AMP phosphodiesterase CpdA